MSIPKSSIQFSTNDLNHRELGMTNSCVYRILRLNLPLQNSDVEAPVPSVTVTVFGDWTFTEVIKVKCHLNCGLSPIRMVSLCKRRQKGEKAR